MSNHKVYLCACLFIIFCSCSKREFAPVPENVYKEELNICACDASSLEFIRGNFNNTDICFSTATATTDTFNNAYYTNTAAHIDHINILRDNINKTMSCKIQFVNPDLHNKTLPYSLPHANTTYNEYAEITLSDLNKVWADNITDDYVGNTYKGFNITITDTTGGYLQGIFSGAANTRYGKKLNIINGIFSVRVIDVKKN